MAVKITNHVWTIGDLIDAALATQPIDPVVTAPERRKRFRVIKGGKEWVAENSRTVRSK